MFWLSFSPALGAAVVVLVAVFVVLAWPRSPGQHRSPAPAGSTVWQLIEQVETDRREQHRRATEQAECTGRHHLRPVTPQTRSCAVTPTRAGPPGGRARPLPPGHRIHRNPCRPEFTRVE